MTPFCIPSTYIFLFFIFSSPPSLWPFTFSIHFARRPFPKCLFVKYHPRDSNGHRLNTIFIRERGENHYLFALINEWQLNSSPDERSYVRSYLELERTIDVEHEWKITVSWVCQICDIFFLSSLYIEYAWCGPWMENEIHWPFWNLLFYILRWFRCIPRLH